MNPIDAPFFVSLATGDGRVLLLLLRNSIYAQIESALASQRKVFETAM